MPFFGGPTAADFHRLERQFERLERQFEQVGRQLETLIAVQTEHAKQANGHPAKVIWHGMTWPQLIGIGLVLIILVIVGVDTVWIRDFAGDLASLAASKSEDGGGAIAPGLMRFF